MDSYRTPLVGSEWAIYPFNSLHKWALDRNLFNSDYANLWVQKEEHIRFYSARPKVPLFQVPCTTSSKVEIASVTIYI